MRSWRLLLLPLLATLALTGCEKENAASPTDGQLLTTHWLLAKVDDQVLTGAATGHPYLEFVDLGSCTVGLGPCNNFSGRFQWRSAEQQLHISAQIPTHATCSAQALETRYLNNLAQTTHYLIRNDELWLYAAASAAPRLVFRRAVQ